MCVNNTTSKCIVCNSALPIKHKLDGTPRNQTKKYCSSKCREANKPMSVFMREYVGA